ncbi:DUF4260 family protein [Neorhizobium lilium]|uniref:DUF4260 family protein n=1 Tax=Neorhizobium lilium TaxID=2503024 RepID=A0A3S3S9M9_9HYPH|nr:DUF4260 domain-containing protein [Neorhizobium lilium]RWX74800.1 DUF4260 family protein [Neorhizobium lilium]
MAQAVLWQRAEGLIIFLAGLAIFWHCNETITWWGALALFFAPDVSFLSYPLGPRVGAFCYNVMHIYALGAALLAIGLTASLPLITAIGALWLAHAGFDRMLRYGLKLPESFSFTHLGQIGRQ